MAAVLQRIQAVVPSWDDLAGTLGNSSSGKWNERVKLSLRRQKQMKKMVTHEKTEQGGNLISSLTFWLG